ncbi:MAG: CHAD domain-containing protein [Terriglobia bacterium]|nr:CHAD domain-containing protein [Terriglobia bacterium]
MAFDLDRVQKDIRRLRKFLKRTPKHPTPEKIHSLRMDTHRFEAALLALMLDSRPNERRVLKKLKKLRSRAGKVRDLDVLTGYVAGVRMEEEDDCLVQLLEYLGAEHAQRTKSLHSFAVQHGPSLRRRLKHTAAYLKMLSVDGVPDIATLGDAMLSELRLRREVAAPVRLNRENLHPYRLKVKELRYVLQMENDPGNKLSIEILGEMKDAIGEWHDWQELLAIASKQLPHGPECKLVHTFQAITKEKFNHALSVANKGRKQALRPFTPAKKHVENRLQSRRRLSFPRTIPPT